MPKKEKRPVLARPSALGSWTRLTRPAVRFRTSQEARGDPGLAAASQEEQFRKLIKLLLRSSSRNRWRGGTTSYLASSFQPRRPSISPLPVRMEGQTASTATPPAWCKASSLLTCPARGFQPGSSLLPQSGLGWRWCKGRCAAPSRTGAPFGLRKEESRSFINLGRADSTVETKQSERSTKIRLSVEFTCGSYCFSVYPEHE